MEEEDGECTSLTPTAAVEYSPAMMEAAFAEAQLALAVGEVPVGCVFVHLSSREIRARDHNRTNARKNALEHAELVAIEQLAAVCESSTNSNTLSLRSYALYVTVEPCIMCAAQLAYLDIGAVFFGCKNMRFGGNGAVASLHTAEQGPRSSACCGGYLSVGGFQAERAIQLLRSFYEKEKGSTSAPTEGGAGGVHHSGRKRQRLQPSETKEEEEHSK